MSSLSVFTLAFLFCFILSFSKPQDNLPTGQPFSLIKCGEYPKYQQWSMHNNSKTVDLYLRSYNASCIDCGVCSIGVTPHILSCSTNKGQQFTFVSGSKTNQKLLQNSQKKQCLQTIASDSYSMIIMNTCELSKGFNEWIFTSVSKTKDATNVYYISSAVNHSLCLTANYFPNGNCSISPYNTYAYCNQQLTAKVRAQDLISRMSVGEKIPNLLSSNPGVPRLGVPPTQYNEALHGVNCRCGGKFNGNTGCPTSFPHATLLASSFNRTLWQAIATGISTEARAFHNQGITGLIYWAPDINLFRDPRWGRGQETPGEDPFLTGQYAMQYTYYMQNGEDTRYQKVVATAKHYADYDQEGNYGINRGSFYANVSDQQQVEYYWPQWRAAIQEGHVSSIMCSYNAVNGMPSCGNNYFMNEIARDQWGFDGFFVSDCGAIDDGAFARYADVHFNGDKSEQMRVAIEGGCDANCGSSYIQFLPQAFQTGIVSETDIDLALSRIFYRRFVMGDMDHPGPIYNKYGVDKIDSPQHRALALNAAQQGIILLKNENHFLPFSVEDINTKKFAFIGPHANATQDMLSIYEGKNTLVFSHSPFMAAVERGLKVTYTQGCNDIACNSSTNFAKAVNAASAADYAIVFLGLHPGQGFTPAREDEGWDRNNLLFPGQQLQLLRNISASATPIVLVLIHGGPIDLSWPAKSARVMGIVDALYPGELGGDAIMGILLGDVSPAGKLVETVYEQAFCEKRSIMDMNLTNNGGITYRYYEGTPVYSFGYGLSYTSFEYENYSPSMTLFTSALANDYRERQNRKKYAFGDDIYLHKKTNYESFVVGVTNTGRMDSDCSVLAYVISDKQEAGSPLIKLFDFQRVFVAVGKTVNVSFSISPESISVVNEFGQERIVPGSYTIIIGEYFHNMKNVKNDNYVKGKLHLIGNEEIIFDLNPIESKIRN